ncbi:hypothetical protein VTG60DRAFT_3298 [Thermothelomyces hinnuleus]
MNEFVLRTTRRNIIAKGARHSPLRTAFFFFLKPEDEPKSAIRPREGAGEQVYKGERKTNGKGQSGEEAAIRKGHRPWQHGPAAKTRRAKVTSALQNARRLTGLECSLSMGLDMRRNMVA